MLYVDVLPRRRRKTNGSPAAAVPTCLRDSTGSDLLAGRSVRCQQSRVRAHRAGLPERATFDFIFACSTFPTELVARPGDAPGP